MKETVQNPHHYKPLRYDLAGERKVHLMKSFVLKFIVDENMKKVEFIFFGHHDEAYNKLKMAGYCPCPCQNEYPHKVNS